MSKNCLYLIPCSLGGEHIDQVIPTYLKEIINNCNYYVVENIRSARRFLIKAGIETKIDDLTFFELVLPIKFILSLNVLSYCNMMLRSHCNIFYLVAIFYTRPRVFIPYLSLHLECLFTDRVCGKIWNFTNKKK